jgi:hypothetical protein
MIPEICPPSPSRTAQQLPSLYTAAGRPGQTGKTRERGTSQQQEKQLSAAAADEKFQVKTQTSPDHYPILTHQHTEDTHRDRVFVFFFYLQRHLRVLVSPLLNASKIFPLLSIILVSSFCLFLAPLLALLLPFLGFSPTVHTLGSCFLFCSPFSYYTYCYVHSS